MTVTPDELAEWQQWVGRSESRSELLDRECLRRFAAAVGENLDVEQVEPSLAHWAFFLPLARADQIGDDGHPLRGGLLPPVSLPRRMFAAAYMRFGSPLTLGRQAERVSTVAAVTHKSGRSGDLVLVDVDHRITQDGEDKVHERQTIIYRSAGERTTPVRPAARCPQAGDVTWLPRSVDLFRFSAVTFNSHRIHYDLPYATGEEGYPALVVHGPFTAVKLFGQARQNGRPSRFGFRALAPIFLGQPVLLRSGMDGSVRAIRADGAEAMVATTECTAQF